MSRKIKWVYHKSYSNSLRRLWVFSSFILLTNSLFLLRLTCSACAGNILLHVLIFWTNRPVLLVYFLFVFYFYWSSLVCARWICIGRRGTTVHDQRQRTGGWITAGCRPDDRVADGRTAVHADDRCRRRRAAGRAKPAERAQQPDGGADERRR